MQVETTRFGPIKVDKQEIIEFPDGLPGFRGKREMILLAGGDIPGMENAQHHSVFWIQDLADPDLAFLTIVPWSAYPDYDIELDAEDAADLEIEDVCVLNIVTVRREDGGVQLTTNLLAPIVIDVKNSQGRQLILSDVTWPVRAPLAEAPREALEKSEQSKKDAATAS